MGRGTSRSVMAMIALNATFVLVVGWLVMILVGVIHGDWVTAIPTIGYNASCVSVLVIRVIAFMCSVMYEIARDR